MWVWDPPCELRATGQFRSLPQEGHAHTHQHLTSPLAGPFSDPQILWFPAITSVIKTWYFA